MNSWFIEIIKVEWAMLIEHWTLSPEYTSSSTFIQSLMIWVMNISVHNYIFYVCHPNDDNNFAIEKKYQTKYFQKNLLSIFVYFKLKLNWIQKKNYPKFKTKLIFLLLRNVIAKVNFSDQALYFILK